MQSYVQIKTVGITSKPRKAEVREVVLQLVEWLRSRGVEFLLDEETAANLGAGDTGLARPEIAAKADLLVVLGGDGTLLATARSLNRKLVPILAVNLGGLGFLTVIPLDELYSTLEMVFTGSFPTERRARIEAEVVRSRQTASTFLALNDIVLNKGAIARLLDFDVWVNGKFITTYKSDGLIVSTPTGSTAYSLAAGGPVIVPTVSAFIMAPICAHTLTHRPIVLPDSVEIEIAMKDHQESVYITVDGQEALGLRSEDRIRLRRSDHSIELIQPPHKDYFEILRQKLKWGERWG